MKLHLITRVTFPFRITFFLCPFLVIRQLRASRHPPEAIELRLKWIKFSKTCANHGTRIIITLYEVEFDNQVFRGDCTNHDMIENHLQALRRVDAPTK